MAVAGSRPGKHKICFPGVKISGCLAGKTERRFAVLTAPKSTGGQATVEFGNSKSLF
jgi:hypothetical protein